MSKSTAEFRIEIESPYGKRAVSEFEHFMTKIRSEAKERWGIEITISRVDEPTENEPEFRTAANQD